MWKVYAIYNERGNVYVGMTKNMDRRLRQHNSNHSTWTRNRGPWKLVYLTEFVSSKDARTHEKYLKGGAGRKIIKTEVARVAELADAHA